MKSSYYSRILRLAPEFQLHSGQSVERITAESYIQEKFHHAYGAQPHEFLSTLLTMQCAGKLSGVAGLSIATRNPLFLEQYLNIPIEQELEKLLQRNIQRSSIVEIGNLVSTTQGASLALFVVLASVLYQAGYKFMAFTATEQLRHKFNRLGFKMHFIAGAKEGALKNPTSDNWGSYYQATPQVVVGSLKQAVDLIATRNISSCVQKMLHTQIAALTTQLHAANGGN